MPDQLRFLMLKFASPVHFEIAKIKIKFNVCMRNDIMLAVNDLVVYTSYDYILMPPQVLTVHVVKQLFCSIFCFSVHVVISHLYVAK